MAKTDFRTVDEYIASRPESVQGVLRRLRQVIRKTLPEAEEVISYQIPAYKLHGRPVIYVAVWKQHYSLYPAVGRMNEVFGDEIAPYKASKGTLRFPLFEPIPVKLIQRIVRFRAGEVAEQAMAKTRSRSRARAASR
jgi:uncharacterized protein YdhG (YjbR/CyaY superfamily)